MESQASQQQFAEARRLFGAGQFKEALQRLSALNQQHPGVFNIQYPMLQCLQRLGRIEDMKMLLQSMRMRYPETQQQEKLLAAEAWLRNQENAAVGTPTSPPVALPADADTPPSTNDIEDYLNIPAQYKVVVPHASPLSSIPWKAVLIGVAAVAIVATGLFALPVLTKALGGSSEFSADVVLAGPHMHLRGKLYQKSPTRTRTEMMEQVFIMDGDKIHMLMPEVNMYMTLNAGLFAAQNPFTELSDFEGWLRKHEVNKTGRETMQGFVCDVYEGQVRVTPQMPPMPMKVWYARKLKYPIRSENTLPGPMGRITAALENIRTDKQPDSLFEIPAGYTQIDVMEEVMGSLMMGDVDDMPSEEEIEKMLREMGLQ